ncbi:MAG: L-serine dehydratase, iron-sulfur-dependent, alpha subunit [candidate division NC10 bacterium]|nr:L-serine dehydratase, iron-sulfur-dependent, alpha subunit [candidate division NC10 bacterium]
MSPSAPAPSICDIRGPLMIGPSGLHATLTGPVEARYIERNAIGVANALAAADMALAGIQSVVPSDEVILALRNVQTLLPMELREHDPRRAGEHADRAAVERTVDGLMRGGSPAPGVSPRPRAQA